MRVESLGWDAGYTGTNWTNNTFLNFQIQRNPNPFGFATGGTNGARVIQLVEGFNW